MKNELLFEKYIKEIVFDLLDTYEDYEDIIENIRSLVSCGELNDNDYDYILDNYDRLLEEYNKKVGNNNGKRKSIIQFCKYDKTKLDLWKNDKRRKNKLGKSFK